MRRWNVLELLRRRWLCSHRDGGCIRNETAVGAKMGASHNENHRGVRDVHMNVASHQLYGTQESTEAGDKIRNWRQSNWIENALEGCERHSFQVGVAVYFADTKPSTAVRRNVRYSVGAFCVRNYAWAGQLPVTQPWRLIKEWVCFLTGYEFETTVYSKKRHSVLLWCDSFFI